MKTLHTDDIRAWYARSGDFSEITRSIGYKQPDAEFLETRLGVPLHLRFVLQKLAEERGTPVPDDGLDSLPFYSLCRGLFLPLSGLEPERAAQIFGLKTDPPPDAAGREKLLAEFLEKKIGLTMLEKLGCILGDPFLGRKSSLRRDSLLRLLSSVQMKKRTEFLDRLTCVGDVSVLFADYRPTLRSSPPLTAAEVLRLLRFLPDERPISKFDLLRCVLHRCGKLEAYFLAKLLLRKAGFGFDFQGPLLARIVGAKYGVAEDQIAHAMALTDAFHVVRLLDEQGPAGLRSIHLQPLVPVRPALAGGNAEELEAKQFPVWVERKYDGIRFMLHKSTDRFGSMLCGAYTRNRNDWLEQVPGLDATIKALPCRSAIVDGELFGTVFSLDGVRPATVYEVYSSLQGQPVQPVTLKFAAFDLIYLDGRELTEFPLVQRRQWLTALVTPLASFPLPIPLSVSEGQMANDKNDLNRLYQHFRSQGYEGIVTKDLHGGYKLATRDPAWAKRKPLITLDLALLGATYSVTTKDNAAMFGSYVIGARLPDGTFEDVGDVAGMDRIRDLEIQQEIMREGLLTGKRIERPSSSGVRPGVQLRPAIVVTVKFEGVIRDQVTEKLSLRDPKIAVIRSDKSVLEADTLQTIEQMYLRQRVG